MHIGFSGDADHMTDSGSVKNWLETVVDIRANERAYVGERRSVGGNQSICSPAGFVNIL